MAALSSSHSCFCRPKRKKNRKSESRFAGFVSGPICPVDFIFMPQAKEQIKNFFQKPGKSSREKLSTARKVYFLIPWVRPSYFAAPTFRTPRRIWSSSIWLWSSVDSFSGIWILPHAMCSPGPRQSAGSLLSGKAVVGGLRDDCVAVLEERGISVIHHRTGQFDIDGKQA